MNPLINDSIDRAMREAYRSQTPPTPGPFWDLKTMSKIRTLAIKSEQKLSNSVWRLAPASAIITALLIACSVAFDFSPRYALEELLLDAPVEQSVAMLIGY